MVFIPANGNSPKPFRFRRSALFMPASNARALAKAPALSCDCLLFDLEDAVAEAERPQAFENLRKVVSNTDFGTRETVIRTSMAHSRHFDEDLAIAMECGANAILLPKVATDETITAVSAQLEKKGSDAALWAMIETPLALINLAAIAGAGSPAKGGRLECLVVGPNDLAKETGVSLSAGRTAMQPWLMQVVAAARAFGMSVLDGVYNNFRDAGGLAAECTQGAIMGFDGKTLIHPAQIEAANAAFGPSETELERARAIVSAFKRSENANRGAIQIDGEMIERLHLEMAERLLGLKNS